MSAKSYSTNFAPPYSLTGNYSRKTVGVRHGQGPYTSRSYYMLKTQWTALIPNGVKTGCSAANNYWAEGLCPGHQDASNRAYGKFRDKLGETANLAVAIAERREAVNMLAKRSAQLLTIAHCIATRNYRAVFKSMGYEVMGKKDYRRTVKYRVVHNRTQRDYEVTFKKSAKSFGDNFLEVVFGWIPIVGDIGNAVEILYKHPLKEGVPTKIIGKATASGVFEKNPTGQYSITWKGKGRVRKQVIADVLVTNLNSLKLKQLGFTNPAALFWEAVPFSFLVDWVVNIGDILSTYDDFIGMTVSQPFTTSSEVLDLDMRYGWVFYSREKHIHVTRSAGISAPTLIVRPPKLPSIQRGLTAVSLLAQFLGKTK